MNERESWNVVRERRMQSPAASAAYEAARAAYDVGVMVRELRESRGLSQRQLAELMGTTQSVVGRLEAGGSRPTLATLDRIAHALGLQLEVRFNERQADTAGRGGSPNRPPRAHARSGARSGQGIVPVG